MRVATGILYHRAAHLARFLPKKFVRQKLFSKNLLTNITQFAIITSVPNIGVSPSGKASDSDSDISGVRIPAPQPTKKLAIRRAFFVGWGARRAEARSASRGGVGRAAFCKANGGAWPPRCFFLQSACALWTNSPRLAVGALHREIFQARRSAGFFRPLGSLRSPLRALRARMGLGYPAR